MKRKRKKEGRKEERKKERSRGKERIQDDKMTSVIKRTNENNNAWRHSLPKPLYLIFHISSAREIFSKFVEGCGHNSE